MQEQEEMQMNCCKEKKNADCCGGHAANKCCKTRNPDDCVCSKEMKKERRCCAANARG